MLSLYFSFNLLGSPFTSFKLVVAKSILANFALVNVDSYILDFCIAALARFALVKFVL